MKIQTHIIRFAIACAMLLTVVGCATSGPKFSEMKTSISPPRAGQGRIFLYRIAAFGAAVQPDIKVNGEVVGTAQPKAFYVVDRPAGTYQIATSTEVKRTLSLTLGRAQTRYVRLNIGMGFFVGHVYPELVEPAVGEREIMNCHQRTK